MWTMFWAVLAVAGWCVALDWYFQYEWALKGWKRACALHRHDIEALMELDEERR